VKLTPREESAQEPENKVELRQKRKKVDENKIITIKGRPSQVD
jgi:hypothetical protein